MDFLFGKLCHAAQRQRSRLKDLCCSLTCCVFVKVKKSLCGNKFALDSLRVQTLGTETRQSAGGKAKKRRRRRCISLFNWIWMSECVGEGRKKRPVNKNIRMLKPGREKSYTSIWLLERLWLQIKYKSYRLPKLYRRQCIYLSTIFAVWLTQKLYTKHHVNKQQQPMDTSGC